MTAYRTALANTSNFGPSGTVTTSINQVVLSTITAGTLVGVNAFVSPWWDVADSASFHSTLVTYFLGGGSLILLDDASGKDGIAAALGLPTVGGLGGPWTAASSMLTGPFGNPGSVITAGQIGFLSPANISSHNGTVCGTNGSGNPTAVCIAPGVYAPGAGALIIVADIDTWSTQATYSPLNGNGRWALNGTAFIVTGGVASSPAPAPSASGVPSLGEWGMVILAAVLIGFGSLMASRRSPNRA
jgi:hypothetical protein